MVIITEEGRRLVGAHLVAYGIIWQEGKIVATMSDNNNHTLLQRSRIPKQIGGWRDLRDKPQDRDIALQDASTLLQVEAVLDDLFSGGARLKGNMDFAGVLDLRSVVLKIESGAYVTLEREADVRTLNGFRGLAGLREPPPPGGILKGHQQVKGGGA